MFLKLITIFILLATQANSAETCSRVAIINYQEVLVDAGASKKGEGLRFYLEKDTQAKDLLNEYQERNRPTIWGAATSTLGSVMILAGLVQTNNDGNVQNKNTFILGGAVLIAMSYLTSKTLQYNNETLLKNAVDQYNKRNLPQIYFTAPTKEENSGFGLGFTQEF
jgi:hypothetical protein